MSKKYALLDTPKKVPGGVVYQIQALRDFGDVKEGDLGGYVASEDNLSQRHLLGL